MSRTVSIWENERYSPVSGFSTNGLLISDRGAYSNEEGTVSWTSLDVASMPLLSTGWEWLPDETWNLDTKGTHVDSEGWSYAPNFGSISTSPSAIKGMTHFVRRRKYSRQQFFSIENICSTKEFTCDHCELEEIQRISELLLESLASASLILYGEKILTLPDIASLKTKLVDTLQLRINVPLGLTVVKFSIDKFGHPEKSTLQKAASIMTSSSPLEKLPERIKELSIDMFQDDERFELAKLCIWKHDAEYKSHCSKVGCGNDCEFVIESCPNKGCLYKLSRKWCSTHDQVCLYKVIKCDRGCGEEVFRGQLDNHKLVSCPLRPVRCPHAFIGCTADLTHKQVESHLEECTQAHLLLSMAVLQEQQNTILSLSKQVHALEIQISGQGIQLGSLAAAQATTMEALRVTDRTVKLHQETLMKADKATNKRVDAVQSEMRTELAGVKKHVRTSDAALTVIQKANESKAP